MDYLRADFPATPTLKIEGDPHVRDGLACMFLCESSLEAPREILAQALLERGISADTLISFLEIPHPSFPTLSQRDRDKLASLGWFLRTVPAHRTSS